MDVGAALAGGFLGTLVFAVALELAAQAGLTRLDLPMIIGAVASRQPPRARLLGQLAQLLVGMAFAVGYGAALDALGAEGWGGGAVAGLANGALFVLLLPVLLPLVHPRVAGRPSGASALEAPGAFLRHYGRWTAPVVVVAHAAYGAIVGGLLA